MKAEQEYWLERGQNEAATYRASDAHIAQQTALLKVLGPIKFASVLDVGCGFGRIGELLRERDIDYTGIDVSPEMIKAANKRLPDGHFTVTTLADFITDEAYDLVLAVEFLMHVPPNEVADAVNTMRSLANRHVVTVDWTEPIAKQAAPHNWRHDYEQLFGDSIVRREKVGRQTIYRVKP
jgi:2-polyprenyl-3-methyl-5-hydroxy-6-metoxy-1,4-benzoquinol methylase